MIIFNKPSNIMQIREAVELSFFLYEGYKENEEVIKNVFQKIYPQQERTSHTIELEFAFFVHIFGLFWSELVN